MTTLARSAPRSPIQRLLAAVALAASLAAPAAALAAKAGELDKRFGGDGTVLRDLGANDRTEDLVVQRDRKVVTVSTVEFRGDLAVQVNRFGADGRIDRRFGNDGRRILALPGDEYEPSVELTNHGKIVVAFGADTNDARVGVARLTRKGTPDRSFDGDGIQTVGYGAEVALYGPPADVAVAPDGKIVTVGFARRDVEGAQDDFGVIRLRPAGGLDEGFGDGGRALIDVDGTDNANAVAIDSAGEITVAGDAVADTSRRLAVARLTDAGEPAPELGQDGTATSPLMRSAADVLTLPGGGLAAAGTVSGDFGLVRLGSDGSPDSAFSDDGLVTVDFADSTDSAAAVARDGARLVLAGAARTQRRGFDFAVARLTPDGEPDLSFSEDGRRAVDFGRTSDEAVGVDVDARGSIVAGGRVEGRGSGSGDRTDTGIARLLGKRD